MDHGEHTDHVVVEVCRLKCQEHNLRYRTTGISHKQCTHVGRNGNHRRQFGFLPSFCCECMCVCICACLCVTEKQSERACVFVIDWLKVRERDGERDREIDR